MTNKADLAGLTADVVVAYVSNNAVVQTEVAAIIRATHEALRSLEAPEQTVKPARPAVPVRSSVQDDTITCLHCGKKFKSIKRHLRAQHNLTADEYRRLWDLKPDYPMAAPNYTAVRSELAKQTGLGRRPR